MRTIADISRLKIEAPDYAAHKLDNNAFIVYRKTSAASTKFVLAITVGGVVKTFTATTGNSVIRWDVSDYLRSVSNGTTVEAAIFEGSSESPIQFWECSMVVYDGVTIQTRNRGDEDTIVVLDDDYMVDIYMRGPATIMNGNPPDIPNEQYSGSGGVLSVSTKYAYPTLLINYEDSHPWGQIWKSNKSDRKVYHLVKPCTGNDMVGIKYVNADGCTRYAFGKFMSNEYSTNRVSYTKSEGVVKDAERSIVSAIGETLEIGFENVPSGQYIEDILLCDSVAIINTDVIATPASSRVVRDGVTRDIVITFNIR